VILELTSASRSCRIARHGRDGRDCDPGTCRGGRSSSQSCVMTTRSPGPRDVAEPESTSDRLQYVAAHARSLSSASDSLDSILAVDPSTGTELAELADSSADDVERAVSRAERAQTEWEAAGSRSRLEVIDRLRSAFEERQRELAIVESVSTGLPIRSAEADVRFCVEHLREWPAYAITSAGRSKQHTQVLSYTAPRPYGVVARLTAFNHPLMFALKGVLMPLLAGNAVVVKPSPQTPLSPMWLMSLFEEILPDGLVHVLSGSVKAAEALVAHRNVRRIGFIGSVAVGLKIQEGAARSGTVKNVSLELGGKNPMIIFPDADLDAAVDGALRGMSFTTSTGQGCHTLSRLLVHKHVHDEFVSRMEQRMRGYVVGVAYDDRTEVGPLASEAQVRSVMRHVDAAVDDGAELVCGGSRPSDVLSGGFFLEPTLFAGVDSRMRIAREEVFGPVVAVQRWSDYDQMLADANGLDVGLSASVWSNDLTVAIRTAEAMQAGYVWINDSAVHYPDTPFGGIKNSGVGREEAGDEFDSYLEQRVIHVRTGDTHEAFRRLSSGM
jgi:betaine-aldehyde dehydrogenase